MCIFVSRNTFRVHLNIKSCTSRILRQQKQTFEQIFPYSTKPNTHLHFHLKQGGICEPQVRTLQQCGACPNHMRIVYTIPYATLTIAGVSLMVLRRTSRTSSRIVSTLFGAELVEGRPGIL